MKTMRRLLAVALAAFLPSSSRAAPGNLDPTFDPNPSGPVYSTAVQTDAKFVVAGTFVWIGGAPHNAIARLNNDGTLDGGFNLATNGPVYGTAVQADGKIVIAGYFAGVGGVARNCIARLNADGTVDNGFDPNVNSQIFGMAVQPDGKIIIVGWFTEVGGVARKYVARLNADGTLDTGFHHPELNLWAYGAAVQDDGKIVIVGPFAAVDGITRKYIARLNADGTLDLTFDPNAEGAPQCVAIQPDGKIIIGGLFFSLRPFGTVMDITRNCIARLNPDGTVDMGFDPNPGDPNVEVHSAVVQADGKIIIGGSFGTMGGVTRNNVARLNADGTLDTAFNPDADNALVSTALQGDGKILLGGTFAAVSGVPRNCLARLDNDPATQSLTVPSASRVQWLRGGSSPETLQVTFELSTDGGVTYTMLGAGTRMAGGWELSSLSLPASGQVRARARTTGCSNNGSSGLVEKVQAFTPAGTIEFSARTYNVNENGGSVTITATRAGGNIGAVGVSYATSDGTATAGSDYTTAGGTLNWTNGDSADKTFSVPITDDGTYEGNEIVNLALSSPTGGTLLGTQPTAVLTIVENDPAPAGAIEFSAANYSVNENGGSATITATRTGGSYGAVGVSYATSNGTAAGSDYTPAIGTLTWANGDTASKNFTVAITDDTFSDGNETVNLALSAPTGGATLGNQSTAVLLIVDDDPPLDPGSLVVTYVPSPPPPVSGGVQRVFDCSISFGSQRPLPGERGTVDVLRLGDFNNSTTSVDANGAPQEGIAVFGLSQSFPGQRYQWVFWPGIDGTPHATADDPAARQVFVATISQDELRDCMDAQGNAQVRIVVGGSVDDWVYLDVRFNMIVILPVATDVSSSGHLRVTFARDPAQTSLTYIVQGSDDLVTWTNLATSTGGSATTALIDGVQVTETNAGTIKTVEVIDTAPLSGKRFLRVVMMK